MPADPSSWLSRNVQRMAANPRFAKVAPSIVPKLDRFLSKVSGGRIMSSSAIVPSIVLVTTGAKSGKQRETPLATDPAARRVLRRGVELRPRGRTRRGATTCSPTPTPPWCSRATASPCRAHLLDPAEKAAVWDELTALWPTYDAYEERTERELRVFELRPAAQQAE